MKFVLAPDSFKESMSSIEACEAMRKGILKVFPNAQIDSIPMADGGEGTVDAFITAVGGEILTERVKGPFNEEVTAKFGLLEGGQTAVIEMAEASGLALVEGKKRNPYYTSTYGTGQLITATLNKGVKKIIIGIGGSATNDAGAGMLIALGARFLDSKRKHIPLGGLGLKDLAYIDLSSVDKRIYNIDLEVACDVTNTLIGESGASYVFAPQKGATKEMVKNLEAALSHYAEIVKKQLKIDLTSIEGGGAAGGLGSALIGLLNGRFTKGSDLIIKYAQLEQKLKDADYVLTGEGSIDFQTTFGKTPFGIAKAAQKYNLPVIAFAGRVGEGTDKLYEEGITAIIGITRGACSLEEALQRGKENLELAVENIMRIIK